MESEEVFGLIVDSIGSPSRYCFAKTEAERDAEIDTLMSSCPMITMIERCNLKRLKLSAQNQVCIHTGVEAFDNQVQGLIVGNTIENTLFGWYIRPRDEMESNNRNYRYGELQEADIRVLSNSFHVITPALQFVRCHPVFRDNGCWIGVVNHTIHKGNKRSKMVHGVVITDWKRQLIRAFSREKLNLSPKPSSATIMEVITPWLTDAIVSERQTVFDANQVVRLAEMETSHG